MGRSQLEPGRFRSTVCGFAVVLALGTGVTPARSQLAADTAGLGGRFGTMHMLLEKTLLKVDVLVLDIRVDTVTASAIEAAIGEAGSPDDAADAIANATIEARGVWARLAFRRGLNVERLIGEIRKSMRKAVAAGLLDQADYETIASRLTEWYAPLQQRGIRNGDAQYYRIRGDTLHTTFVGRDGDTFIDQTAIARANRTAVLASWFASGSEFREELIESLPSSARDGLTPVPVTIREARPSDRPVRPGSRGSSVARQPTRASRAMTAARVAGSPG